MSNDSIYKSPIAEIVWFGNEGVMTISGGGGGIELPEDEW